MNDPLEAILAYGMNELESKAYKISLLWQSLSQKEFPNYQHVKVRKTGDPRKSTLFKYCYKLARETNGIISDPEYKLYILAQLHVLKGITDGKVHALIDPSILCGDKAWKRWKLWKWHYDQKMRQHQNDEQIQTAGNSFFVIPELDSTKSFLEEKAGGAITFDVVQESILSRKMIGWVTLGKVSPYYVILSPFVHKSLDEGDFESQFKFDLGVYKKLLTPEIEEEFRKRFSNEYVET